MEELLEQIERSLECNLYYLALFVSLTLPDICAGLESNNGQTDRIKYECWYNSNVKDTCSKHLSGYACYKFRCALLHQGRICDRKIGYSRILFVEPEATTNIFHDNIIDDALNIDVRIFCTSIIAAVRNWINKSAGNPVFEKNYEELITRHPNGLDKYIVGVPVIS